MTGGAAQNMPNNAPWANSRNIRLEGEWSEIVKRSAEGQPSEVTVPEFLIKRARIIRPLIDQQLGDDVKCEDTHHLQESVQSIHECHCIRQGKKAMNLKVANGVGMDLRDSELC